MKNSKKIIDVIKVFVERFDSLFSSYSIDEQNERFLDYLSVANLVPEKFKSADEYIDAWQSALKEAEKEKKTPRHRLIQKRGAAFFALCLVLLVSWWKFCEVVGPVFFPHGSPKDFAEYTWPQAILWGPAVLWGFCLCYYIASFSIDKLAPTQAKKLIRNIGYRRLNDTEVANSLRYGNTLFSLVCIFPSLSIYLSGLKVLPLLGKSSIAGLIVVGFMFGAPFALHSLYEFVRERVRL